MFAEFGTVTSTMVQKDPKGRTFAFVNFEDSESAKKAIEGLEGKDFRTDEDKAADKKDEEKKAEEKAEKEKEKEGEEKKDEEKKDEEKKEEEKPEDYGLYIGRAMSKSERSRKLAAEFGVPLKGKGKGGKGTGREGVNLYIKNLDESITDEKLKELFCTFGKITSAKCATDDKGTSKGFGFVCFSTPEEATKAVTEMHLKMVSGKPLYVGLAEQREQRVARLAQRFKGGGKGGGFGGGGYR